MHMGDTFINVYKLRYLEVEGGGQIIRINIPTRLRNQIVYV